MASAISQRPPVMRTTPLLQRLACQSSNSFLKSLTLMSSALLILVSSIDYENWAEAFGLKNESDVELKVETMLLCSSG